MVEIMYKDLSKENTYVYVYEYVKKHIKTE